MIGNPLLAGLRPTHPGEILREDIFPALGKSKVELARLLGVSRGALYNILDEKAAITPEMALRLGKLLGSNPDFWLRLQDTYDLTTRAKELARELRRIPTLQAVE